MAKADKLDETVARLREEILRGTTVSEGYFCHDQAWKKNLGISHSVMNHKIAE